MMKKIVLISIVCVLANLCTSVLCFANESSTNTVTGVIYVDRNDSGAFETGEATVGDVVINCQELGSDLIESFLADENGEFSIDGVTAGKYVVWSEIDGVISDKTMVHVDGTNSNVIINVAMSVMSAADDTVDMEMIQIQTLLLPVVMS